MCILFYYNSTDFGKTFRRINAEVFDTHIRKDGGIMKSPKNPNKVCPGNLFTTYNANVHLLNDKL